MTAEQMSRQSLTTEELVARASPLIGSIGGAFYFHPDTVARGRELELGGLRFYFLGRGGVLGDVEPGVITSAFGYFEPGLVAKLWTSATEKLAPREAGREYLECARAFARTHFGRLDGLDAYCRAAEAVNDATDATSLALYAGLDAEPLCDDVAGRAMQLTMLLREYRGSAHLAAVRCCGLAPAVAHAIKRPDDVATFGYDAPPPITDADRAAHARAETLTDEMVSDAFAVLDATGGADLLAGLEAMTTALAG